MHCLERTLRSYTLWNLMIVGASCYQPLYFLPWAQWSSLCVTTVVLNAVLVEQFPIREFYRNTMPGLYIVWIPAEFLIHYLPLLLIGLPTSYEGLVPFLSGFLVWVWTAMPRVHRIYPAAFDRYHRVLLKSILCMSCYGIIVIHRHSVSRLKIFCRDDR